MQQRHEQNRITSGTKVLMIMTAVFADLLGLIPVLGVLINWLVLGFFYLWFATKGVNPIGRLSKKTWRFAGNIFGETIVETILAWPGTTFMVIQVINEVEAEDADKNKEKKATASRRIPKKARQKKR